MQYSSTIVDFVKFSAWHILFVLKRFQIFQIIATQFQLPKLVYMYLPVNDSCLTIYYSKTHGDIIDNLCTNIPYTFHHDIQLLYHSVYSLSYSPLESIV